MPPGKFSGATPRDLVLSPENPQFFIPHIRQPRPPRVSARALLFFSDAAATRFATTSQARRVLRGLGERTAFARPSPDILLERFGGHPGPPKLGRPMQTPRVCMADRRRLLPCRLCIGATQPVGGTRRSRCTLPAPRDAPWRWRPQRQSPPTTSMSPTGDACSTGSPAILARRSATVQRSRSEARAGVGVLCLHRRTHHGDGGRNGKVRRRRACLRPATPA
jgi:hypothetical protein